MRGVNKYDIDMCDIETCMHGVNNYDIDMHDVNKNMI